MVLALVLHHISSAVSSQQMWHAPPDLEGAYFAIPQWQARHPQALRTQLASCTSPDWP